MTKHIDLSRAEKDRVTAWNAAIRLGIDQLDAGQGIAYTPAALGEISRSAVTVMHGSAPIARDVLP